MTLIALAALGAFCMIMWSWYREDCPGGFFHEYPGGRAELEQSILRHPQVKFDCAKCGKPVLWNFYDRYQELSARLRDKDV